MNAIALPTAPATLEACLTELARYGSPMLTQFNMSGEWFCKVNMRVNATGVTFEAKANGETPIAAAQECCRNMVAAIKTVNTMGAPA